MYPFFRKLWNITPKSRHKTEMLRTLIVFLYSKLKLKAGFKDSGSTYSNIEVIIVDNCPTDSAVEVLGERYAEEIPVQVVTLKKNLRAAVEGMKVLRTQKEIFGCLWIMTILCTLIW